MIIFTMPIKRNRGLAQKLSDSESSKAFNYGVDNFYGLPFEVVALPSESNMFKLESLLTRKATVDHIYSDDAFESTDPEKVDEAIMKVYRDYGQNALVLLPTEAFFPWISKQLGKEVTMDEGITVYSFEPQSRSLEPFEVPKKELKEEDPEEKQEALFRAKNFLNESAPFYVGSVDRFKPEIRPFLAAGVYKGELLIATLADKAVTKQLLLNPNIQLVGLMPDKYTWTRISGVAHYHPEEEYQIELLKQCPALEAFFGVGDDSGYVTFGVDITKSEYYPDDYELPDLSDRESLIFLVRHGETEANVQHVVQGSEGNSQLTEKGKIQSSKRAEAFKDADIDVLVTSTLDRAISSGEFIEEAANIGEVIRDERLKERFFGPINGRPNNYVPPSYFYSPLGEGTESPEDLYDRVNEALTDISKNYDGDAVVVAHAAALANWISKKTNNTDFRLGNCSCTVVDGDTLEVIGFDYPNEVIKVFLDRKKNKA